MFKLNVQTLQMFSFDNKIEDYHNLRAALLLIEDDVWEPDIFRGNSDGSDSSIFLWVPSKFVINPLLVNRHRK